MAATAKQIPMFFKLFSDADRAEKLHLPESWCSYMGRSLPCEVFLRNRYGDTWEVKVAHYQNTDKFWFEEGWRALVEQNKLAYKDHIVFKYDGESTFDIKIFDENGDEKEYTRISNSKEEKEKEQLQDMELEQVVPEIETEPEERRNIHPEPVESELVPQPEQQSKVQHHPPEPEEQHVMQLLSQVEPYLELEAKERQDMQMGPEETQVMQLMLAPCNTPSKFEYSASDEEDEDYEPGDDYKEENTIQRSKIVVQKRAPAINEEDEESIFRTGFPRPDNPYFVTKRRRCKGNNLYVPTPVVKDFELTFPEHIGIRDERGNEWTADVRKWKDGRLWLSKGWKAFCKWNNVKRDDWCIFEIVRPETQEAEMFLKAHVVLGSALRALRR